jgi:hypothetical protein
MVQIPSLYVSSATRQSIGKTAFCIGLALKLREEGLRIGYFKPLGWRTARLGEMPIDEDALLMKSLLNLDAPLELLTPILLDYYYLDQLKREEYAPLRERMTKAFGMISDGADLVIVEALHEPCLGSFMGLSVPKLAKILGSSILLISSTQRDYVVDEILFEHERLHAEGARCSGVVFNNVPRTLIERARGLMAPVLGTRGITTWGIIPESTPVTAPTVRTIADALSAEFLSGAEEEDLVVENYLIGAMTQESAIRYFRKTPRKAVITGGDRPDICLAALETDTSVIILTGNLHPDVQVLTRAEEKGVPVLLVPYDTFTTVEKLGGATGRIRVGDSKKITLMRDLVADYVDWRGLLSNVRGG